jgi:hypothetical protein
MQEPQLACLTKHSFSSKEDDGLAQKLCQAQVDVRFSKSAAINLPVVAEFLRRASKERACFQIRKSRLFPPQQ